MKSWLGIFTHLPDGSNLRPWYVHYTVLPSSLPIESGAWRWQQRSSSAIAFPSRVRYRTTGSSSMTRRTMLRPISWSHAATYQLLRTNILPPLQQHARIAQALVAVDQVDLLRLDSATGQPVRAPRRDHAGLLGAKLGHQEIGADHPLLAGTEHFDIAHLPHTTARRHLRPRFAGAQAKDAVLEPAPVVEVDRHLAARIAGRLGSGYPDDAMLRIHREPILEAILVEQPRLALEDLAAFVSCVGILDFELGLVPVFEGGNEIVIEPVVDVTHRFALLRRRQERRV